MKAIPEIQTSTITHVHDWFDAIIRYATKAWGKMAAEGLDWMPLAHILTPTGDGKTYTQHVIPMPFTDDNEKHMMIGMLKNLCKLHGAVGFCLVTEAWLLALQPTEDVKKALDKNQYPGGIPPRDHKDRIETFIITMETANNVKQRTWRIVRPSTGKKPYLKDWADARHLSGIQGQMVGVLAEDPELNLN